MTRRSTLSYEETDRLLTRAERAEADLRQARAELADVRAVLAETVRLAGAVTEAHQALLDTDGGHDTVAYLARQRERAIEAVAARLASIGGRAK